MIDYVDIGPKGNESVDGCHVAEETCPVKR